MTPERPAFLCPLEIDQRNPDAIIEALTIERDNLLETCESLSQQDANLSARVAELEAEQNRLLMMTVDPVGVAFQRKCERKDILAIVRAVEEEADLDTEHGVGWSQACRSIDNRISRL